jgi:hypothetical protein
MRPSLFSIRRVPRSHGRPVAKVSQQDYAPDCIANEDGERQIATAVSFHGEEVVRRDTSVRNENLRTPVYWQSSETPVDQKC